MNAFWNGFEKKAASRIAKELAKHISSIKPTPKSLAQDIRGWDFSELRRLSAEEKSFLRIDGIEYFDNIRDIRNKFRPAEAPRSAPERLAVLKKMREETELATMKKEQKAKALAAKNRFFDALK